MLHVRGRSRRNKNLKNTRKSRNTSTCLPRPEIQAQTSVIDTMLRQGPASSTRRSEASQKPATSCTAPAVVSALDAQWLLWSSRALHPQSKAGLHFKLCWPCTANRACQQRCQMQTEGQSDPKESSCDARGWPLLTERWLAQVAEVRGASASPLKPGLLWQACARTEASQMSAIGWQCSAIAVVPP